MARTRPSRDEHLEVRKTRISAAYIAVAVAVVFLILLIDFIAQNNRSVPLHFFTASGHVSLALALLVAAVAGAVVVLLVGTARIIQLRLGAHRHNRAVRRRQQADDAADRAESAPSSQRETQAVEPEQQP
jgi:uncharacterized integral membrane protein